MSSIELQGLVHAVRTNQAIAYSDLASMAVLAYDYLLTFKFEVGLVWGTPWNIGRILYALTKYSVLVDSSLLAYFHFAGGRVVSIRTCSLVYQISGWFIYWGIGVAEFVLVFRTWAIWGQSRKLAVILVALTVAFTIPSAYLTHLGLTSSEYAESPVPRIQSCFVIANRNAMLFWDYILILAWETIILVLTLIKGVSHYRHSTSSLVATLYKDGIIYYIYLTTLSIVNVLFLRIFDGNNGASIILMQRVLHSILTARILLHLRLAAVRDRRDASKSDTPPGLSTVFENSRHGQLSTFFIGADTWFGDSDSNGGDVYDLVQGPAGGCPRNRQFGIIGVERQGGTLYSVPG